MNAAPPPAGRAAGETITAALKRLVEETEGEATTYREVLDRLGSRGYGFAMMLLAAPNLTPGPSLPGFSTIFGIPMLALAIGMLVGIPNPRLPQWLARRRLARDRLARFVGKMLPIAGKADQALFPRWFTLVDMTRLNGASLALLAVLLILPFPFVSLAAALAALLIALGLIADDGLAIALGQAMTVVSVILYAVFGWIALAALGWV